MNKRKKQYSDDLCALSHDATRDGLTAQDLVDVLLAAVHGVVVVACRGTERDMAALYWELSRHHDAIADKHSGEHLTPLTCSSSEFNAAFGQQ